MRSDHTAPLVTKPQWSALLHQGRHACPDAKRTGLSHKGRTKKGARLTLKTDSTHFWLHFRGARQAASLRIARGYATQPLASPAHMGKNNAEALIKTG